MGEVSAQRRRKTGATILRAASAPPSHSPATKTRITFKVIKCKHLIIHVAPRHVAGRGGRLMSPLSEACEDSNGQTGL